MSHIKNFYEDFGFPLEDIPSLIEDACLCRLKNVTEKLDGQNFTFTVKTGFMGPQVKFLGKGMPKSIVDIGGLDRSGIQERFSSTPIISDTFTRVYDILQRLIESMPEQLLHNEFDDGQVAWSAEVLCPETRNIIAYSKRSIRLIGSTHQSSVRFPELCEERTQADEWVVGPVPNLKQLRRLDAAEEAKRLTTDWRVRLAFKSFGPTIGDLRTTLVAEQLRAGPGHGWRETVIRSAAARLALNDKSRINKKGFGSDVDWKRFQELESSSVFVNESLMPLEMFFRQLGVYTLETVKPMLAESTSVELDLIIGMVKKVQRAIKEGRISADPSVMKRIESANRRCPSWQDLASLHTKNIEGIVFEWKGQKRKLTGYYTPINRLLGYFRFGQNPAMIV